MTRILFFKPSNKPEGNFLLAIDTGSDQVPMDLNHLGKFFLRFESCDLRGGAPVIEKTSGCLIVPELAKGLLEEVRRIQSIVCIE